LDNCGKSGKKSHLVYSINLCLVWGKVSINC